MVCTNNATYYYGGKSFLVQWIQRYTFNLYQAKSTDRDNNNRNTENITDIILQISFKQALDINNVTHTYFTTTALRQLVYEEKVAINSVSHINKMYFWKIRSGRKHNATVCVNTRLFYYNGDRLKDQTKETKLPFPNFMLTLDLNLQTNTFS